MLKEDGKILFGGVPRTIKMMKSFAFLQCGQIMRVFFLVFKKS
jgi:hypothetical protein